MKNVFVLFAKRHGLGRPGAPPAYGIVGVYQYRLHAENRAEEMVSSYDTYIEVHQLQ